MLPILLFILSLFATISLLAWLYILLQPARPWNCQPVGDDGDILELPNGVLFPPVVIIVPARNEADSLPRTLPALLQQEYPGEYRVFLVDDRSTDQTADVGGRIAAELGCAARLEVIRGAPLPPGWVGKVWAMDQGVRVVASTAQFFLLTDADILHATNSLRRLVAESLNQNLALNSRMARLRCESTAERLLIPAFVFFFNLLYPIRRVNHAADPLAACAGGCVLLSKEALSRLGGGFESIRSEIIDDVNLARQVKGRGLPIRLSLSRSDVASLREYPRLSDVWGMVRRTAFTELKYSWARLGAALLGLGLLFVVPVLALLGGVLAVGLGEGLSVVLGAWAVVKGCLALAVCFSVYGPTIRFFGLRSSWTLTLPFAGLLYGAMTLDSALRHIRGRAVQWRELNPR